MFLDKKLTVLLSSNNIFKINFEQFNTLLQTLQHLGFIYSIDYLA